MSVDSFGVRREFVAADGSPVGQLYSLPALRDAGVGDVTRLPVCLRVVLESLLRNEDGDTVTRRDIEALAGWQPNSVREVEVPFAVARVLAPDSSGIPLIADLLAMRSAVGRLGHDPDLVSPVAPLDLVVDHSVQVDVARLADAVQQNMRREFDRNRERYEFLKWAASAVDNIAVVPPGVGICHQVNLEHLAPGVVERDGVYFPDTLYGADSHTTMINSIGVVGWGVGGIEALSAMLGLPTNILLPDVVGVHLTGALPTGATATDAVLTVVERLREVDVVGKFVEYFGEGAESLSVPDRATISNMSPEYGATIGFFAVDEVVVDYFRTTGRPAATVDAMRDYFEAQQMFGMPEQGQVDYTEVVEIDLSTVVPSVAGPRRPQDRIPLFGMKESIGRILSTPVADGGYGKADGRADGQAFVTSGGAEGRVSDGSVVLAAITSCTNTSNPAVMLAAGLLARNAVGRGLTVQPWIKTSLAPGSRVVSRYLETSGLQPYLDKLGFRVVGYGCTTCVGNSGPLDPSLEETIVGNDVVAAAVLSGNRNFEARIHPNIKANFLMSPPLVVAMAIAGRVDIDVETEPLGLDPEGRPVMLADLWPTPQEIGDATRFASDTEGFRALYDNAALRDERWDAIEVAKTREYAWQDDSTYLKQPPFLDALQAEPVRAEPISGARALAVLGDTVTTDHISPGGAIKADSPAGEYLQAHGVPPREFNTYIARRANHEVMVRGTFANVRIRNRMLPGVEGGLTAHQPDGSRLSIYEAALRYQRDGVPVIVLAGQLYGTGSSRDWASKGTQLLGVRAVVANSFERIHRSNLVMMGVLPCQLPDGVTTESLGLDGTETYDLSGPAAEITPRQKATLTAHRADGTETQVGVTIRIDTAKEADYYRHGGILPYVIRRLLAT